MTGADVIGEDCVSSKKVWKQSKLRDTGRVRVVRPLPVFFAWNLNWNLESFHLEPRADLVLPSSEKPNRNNGRDERI